jgi:hypothetical protein
VAGGLALRIGQNESPQRCARGGFRSVGAGHWGGGGSRPARTYGNARTGRVFPGLSAVPVSLDFRFATIGHRAVSIRAAPLGPPT